MPFWLKQPSLAHRALTLSIALQAGQHVDATLVGFDAKTGKVWLSTKPVQPIALDDMLNALVEESALPAPAPDSRTVLGTSFKSEVSSAVLASTIMLVSSDKLNPLSQDAATTQAQEEALLMR